MSRAVSQEKSFDWEAWETELLAVDTAPGSYVFVNQTVPYQSASERLVSLVRQAIGAPVTFGSSLAARMVPLVRGSHSPVRTPISRRALSSLHARTPRKTVRRQRVDDVQAALWFENLRISPDMVPLAVHVRLSDEIIRRALAQTKLEPLDWLRRRLNRYLKQSLGYTPAMILAAGTKSRGGDRLHLHAIVAVRSHDDAAAIDAFRRCDEWFPKRARANQIATKAVKTAGEAVYCLENAEEAKRSGLIPGKTFVTSGAVRVPKQKV